MWSLDDIVTYFETGINDNKALKNQGDPTLGAN